MPKACIYALPAFVLSNGSICGCGNELEYIEGEQRYVNFVNKRMGHINMGDSVNSFSQI